MTQILDPSEPHQDARLFVPRIAGAGRPSTLTLLPNLLVNDPAGQVPYSGNTQTEPTIAACGDTVVCGFTDSGGFFGDGTLTGYAVSFDGGSTWSDSGSLPRLFSGPSEMVMGDATLLTDGQGRWYCLSVYDVGNGADGPGTGDLGLVLQRATFAGTSLQWSLPWIVAGTTSGDALDNPHLAIDPARDRLYITYTRASVGYAYGQIEVLTLGGAGTTILHQVVVQPLSSVINNAGSSLAVGPDGEVYCAWESGLLDGDGQGPALQLIARSLDQGTTFSAPVTAGTVVESWLSGPPGFNREQYSVEYPAVAVDCSDGPRRGRVYLSWHHGVQMDFAGTLTPVNETTSPNDSPETAQLLPAANGQLQINGSIPGTDWTDWYRFSGDAGDHMRMIVIPASAMRLQLRLWSGEGPGGALADTLLAGSKRLTADWVFFLFSLPRTGDYYMSITRTSGTPGSYTGLLRRANGTTPGPAIDHRDIVVASSPDGVSGWSAVPIRVNDDSGFTDQSMPALAVDGLGGLHVSWYDRRFDPRWRAGADFMLASSFDGGATFTPNARVSSVSSWWQVPADIIPNFGDFNRPCAAGDRLYLVWTDGRGGDPDVMAAPLRTRGTVDLPDSVWAHVSDSLDVEVVVTNDTPYDGASFTVQIEPEVPELPDTTVVLPPLDRGVSAVVSYEPLIGLWIHQYGRFDVDILVSSDRSAGVDTHTVRVLGDRVDVQLSDVELNRAGPGARLEWRASPAARFDVERAGCAAGPYVRLTASPLGPERGDRFAFDDPAAPATEACAYRLIGHDADGTTQVLGPWVLTPATLGAPARVALLGAQPNPFNPATTLRFELPHSGPVTLRVLDVRGRLVAELLRGAVYSAGQHTVRWEAGGQGVSASSGVYIAELEALGTRVTKRVVLLQ